MTRSKLSGTAVAATAWIATSVYLFITGPSLAALFETVASPPAGVGWLIQLPRAAFLALGVTAVLGLIIKDRCLRSPMALVIDAVVGAPAFAALAMLLGPFFIPVE